MYARYWTIIILIYNCIYLVIKEYHGSTMVHVQKHGNIMPVLLVKYNISF